MFIKMPKRKGRGIDPCGTLIIISVPDLKSVSIFVLCQPLVSSVTSNVFSRNIRQNCKYEI